ncbi:MAG: glycoside hydrolase family 127 protein, partial [Planctomycetales bacterium]|nr:glycoside hydrolase family 127 protein [Planctomycetales bacterium]
RDPALEEQMDDIVEAIAASQEPDGYLNATRTLYPTTPLDMMGDGKYAYVDHSHELYIVGHLYEAAVAYFRATGKRKLLDVAEKNAGHVAHVFFEGDPRYNHGRPVRQAPGHEEIELALVRLADATGNPEYLETARKFLDIRGVTHRPNGDGVFSATYAQQHAPVTDQSAPTGHAVRATYLYAGMADVGALLGISQYNDALTRIWNNIVDTRMHITGGLGAVHGIEGFGPEFELPNDDAFNETCAAVGNVLFNWRMFLLHQDAKYLDVAEVALFNNVLAGMNLEGNRFFYINPLAADGWRPFNHGRAERSPWFGTACCPTNLARLIPQASGMLYALDDDGVTLCLYAASQTRVEHRNVSIDLRQTTKYPFDGAIQVTLNPERPIEMKLRLRVPTWTGRRFCPGELYHFADDTSRSPTLKINGQEIALDVRNGFAEIHRTWNPGDVVQLNLPMPVRAVRCDARVKANQGRVAVTRGPLVMCAESCDNDSHVYNYMLAPSKLTESTAVPLSIAEHQTLAVDVPAARLIDAGGSAPASLRMIPYYAWNNRGVGSMAVWLPDNVQTLRTGAIRIDDNASRFAAAKATHTYENDSVAALTDGRLPKNSFDESIPRWTSWPQRGVPQQVEFSLSKPLALRTIEVYWYDDHGGVQTPASWDLEVRSEGEWQPFELYNTDSYQTQPDQYNVVHPAQPITINAIRLNVRPKKDAAVGALEFIVRPEATAP